MQERIAIYRRDAIYRNYIIYTRNYNFNTGIINSDIAVDSTSLRAGFFLH